MAQPNDAGLGGGKLSADQRAKMDALRQAMLAKAFAPKAAPAAGKSKSATSSSAYDPLSSANTGKPAAKKVGATIAPAPEEIVRQRKARPAPAAPPKPAIPTVAARPSATAWDRNAIPTRGYNYTESSTASGRPAYVRQQEIDQAQMSAQANPYRPRGSAGSPTATPEPEQRPLAGQLAQAGVPTWKPNGNGTFTMLNAADELGRATVAAALPYQPPAPEPDRPKGVIGQTWDVIDDVMTQVNPQWRDTKRAWAINQKAWDAVSGAWGNVPDEQKQAMMQGAIEGVQNAAAAGSVPFWGLAAGPLALNAALGGAQLPNAPQMPELPAMPQYTLPASNATFQQQMGQTFAPDLAQQAAEDFGQWWETQPWRDYWEDTRKGAMEAAQSIGVADPLAAMFGWGAAGFVTSGQKLPETTRLGALKNLPLNPLSGLFWGVGTAAEALEAGSFTPGQVYATTAGTLTDALWQEMGGETASSNAADLKPDMNPVEASASIWQKALQGLGREFLYQQTFNQNYNPADEAQRMMLTFASSGSDNMEKMKQAYDDKNNAPAKKAEAEAIYQESERLLDEVVNNPAVPWQERADAKILAMNLARQANEMFNAAQDAEVKTYGDIANEYMDWRPEIFFGLFGDLWNAIDAPAGAFSDFLRATQRAGWMVDAADAPRLLRTYREAGAKIADTMAKNVLPTDKEFGVLGLRGTQGRSFLGRLLGRTGDTEAHMDASGAMQTMSQLLAGVDNAADARRLLDAVIDNPQQLLDGVPGLTSEYYRNMGDAPRFGPTLVAGDSGRRTQLLAQYAAEDLRKMRSLADDAGYNPIEVMAELDAIFYRKARQVRGLTALDDMPIGAVDMKVTPAGDGKVAVAFLDKKGAQLATSLPMTQADADNYIRAARSAVEAGKSDPLTLAVMKTASIQRGFLADMWLNLRPAHWIRNATAAMVATMSDDLLAFDSVAQMSDGLAAKLGVAPTERVFSALTDKVRGQTGEMTGEGEHWARQFQKGIPFWDPAVGFYAHANEFTQKLWTGMTAILGTNIPFGEQAFYTRAYYKGFQRAFAAAWGDVIDQQFGATLKQMQVPKPIAESILNRLRSAGVMGSKADVAKAAREAIMGATVAFDLRALKIDNETISKKGWNALDKVLQDYAAGTVFEEGLQGEARAIADIKRIIADEKPRFQRILAQNLPPQSPNVAATVNDIELAAGAEMDYLIEMGTNAGATPEEAQAIARQLAERNVATEVAGWQRFIQEMHSTEHTDAMIVAFDLMAENHELRLLAQMEVDKYSKAAVNATPATRKSAWNMKWFASREIYQKLAVDQQAAFDNAVTRLRQLVAGEPIEKQYDWWKAINRYTDFDEEKLADARALEVGSTRSTPQGNWDKVIDANRQYVDTSYVLLFEAWRKFPDLDGLDLIRNTERDIDVIGSRVAAELKPIRDALWAKQEAGTLKKGEWDAYFALRNSKWNDAFDRQVLANRAAAQAIVANGMAAEVPSKLRWTEDFPGHLVDGVLRQDEYMLIGPTPDGRWRVRDLTTGEMVVKSGANAPETLRELLQKEISPTPSLQRPIFDPPLAPEMADDLNRVLTAQINQQPLPDNLTPGIQDAYRRLQEYAQGEQSLLVPQNVVDDFYTLTGEYHKRVAREMRALDELVGTAAPRRRPDDLVEAAGQAIETLTAKQRKLYDDARSIDNQQEYVRAAMQAMGLKETPDGKWTTESGIVIDPANVVEIRDPSSGEVWTAPKAPAQAAPDIVQPTGTTPPPSAFELRRQVAEGGDSQTPKAPAQAPESPPASAADDLQAATPAPETAPQPSPASPQAATPPAGVVAPEAAPSPAAPAAGDPSQAEIDRFRSLADQPGVDPNTPLRSRYTIRPKGQPQQPSPAAAFASAPSAETFRPLMQRAFNLTDQQAGDVDRLAAARANVWAKQTGRDANEWYGAHFADIVQGGDAGPEALLQRLDYDTPEFRAWFKNASGYVKQNDGTPAQFYHGSPTATFDAFDPDMANDASLYGPGFYFTRDADIAGGMVLPNEYRGKRTEYKTARGAKQRAQKNVTELKDTFGELDNVYVPRVERDDYYGLTTYTPIVDRVGLVFPGYAQRGQQYSAIARRNNFDRQHIQPLIDQLTFLPDRTKYEDELLEQAVKLQTAYAEVSRLVDPGDPARAAAAWNEAQRRHNNFRILLAPKESARARQLIGLVDELPPTGVFPVHLNVKRPIDMNMVPTADEATALADVWRRNADELQGSRKSIADESFRQMFAPSPSQAGGYEALPDITNEIIHGEMMRTFSPRQAQEMLRAAGYDGITHIGGMSRKTPHRVVIAFEPNQIKSVFNTTPTADPRLLYQDSLATQTPQFRQWFGDSKVVDEQGAPLRVYHGTGSVFDTFDLSKAGSATDSNWFGQGFYFSPQPNIANQYASTGTPNVGVFYLSIQNPYIWREAEGRSMRGATPAQSWAKRQELLQRGYDGVFVHDTIIKSPNGLTDAQWEALIAWYRAKNTSGTYLTREMAEGVIKRGVRWDDFVRYFGEDLAKQMPQERQLVEAVAFYPHQVKSALANVGTFNPDDPSVLRQTRAATARGAAEFLDGGRAILRGLAAPDVSTAVHEMAHVFRRDLATVARMDERAAADMLILNKWVGLKPGQAWTREMEEQFARGFETYLKSGQAPTPELQSAFARFKEWLTEIYRALRGEAGPKITPQMRGVYDRLLADAPAPKGLDLTPKPRPQGPQTPTTGAMYDFAWKPADDAQQTFDAALEAKASLVVEWDKLKGHWPQVGDLNLLAKDYYRAATDTVNMRGNPNVRLIEARFRDVYGMDFPGYGPINDLGDIEAIVKQYVDAGHAIKNAKQELANLNRWLAQKPADLVESVREELEAAAFTADEIARLAQQDKQMILDTIAALRGIDTGDMPTVNGVMPDMVDEGWEAMPSPTQAAPAMPATPPAPALDAATLAARAEALQAQAGELDAAAKEAQDRLWRELNAMPEEAQGIADAPEIVPDTRQPLDLNMAELEPMAGGEALSARPPVTSATLIDLGKGAGYKTETTDGTRATYRAIANAINADATKHGAGWQIPKELIKTKNGQYIEVVTNQGFLAWAKENPQQAEQAAEWLAVRVEDAAKLAAEPKPAKATKVTKGKKGKAKITAADAERLATEASDLRLADNEVVRGWRDYWAAEAAAKTDAEWRASFIDRWSKNSAQAKDVLQGDRSRVADDIRRGRISRADAFAMVNEAYAAGKIPDVSYGLWVERLTPDKPAYMPDAAQDVDFTTPVTPAPAAPAPLPEPQIMEPAPTLPPVIQQRMGSEGNAYMEARRVGAPDLDIAALQSALNQPRVNEPVSTVAGKMTLDDFERMGYTPEQVTRQDWVNLQRANRRYLGQSEMGDNPRAPFSEYEEYHRDAVKRAVDAGDQVDPQVLADYPDLARQAPPSPSAATVAPENVVTPGEVAQVQAGAPAGLRNITPNMTGKPRLVGVEWKSQIGEKWSSYEGGIVDARVSDWDKSEISAGSGREIVHVYWIQEPDGTVKPYGRQTAADRLGYSRQRIDREAQKYLNQMEEAKQRREWFTKEVAGIQGEDTTGKAYRDLRIRNRSQSDDRINQNAREARLFERDGKYYARSMEPGGEYEQIMLAAGWKEIEPPAFVQELRQKWQTLADESYRYLKQHLDAGEIDPQKALYDLRVTDEQARYAEDGEILRARVAGWQRALDEYTAKAPPAPSIPDMIRANEAAYIARAADAPAAVTPGVMEMPGNVEPWQMTKYDYATQWSGRMNDLRSTKPRPIDKMFGTRGPTPEQAEAYKAQTAAWNKEYRAASKAHNAYLADQGAHRRIVEQALAEGKPVPASVLADYPDLARQAPPSPSPATVAPENVVAPGEVAAITGERVAFTYGDDDRLILPIPNDLSGLNDMQAMMIRAGFRWSPEDGVWISKEIRRRDAAQINLAKELGFISPDEAARGGKTIEYITRLSDDPPMFAEVYRLFDDRWAVRVRDRKNSETLATYVYETEQQARRKADALAPAARPPAPSIPDMIRANEAAYIARAADAPAQAAQDYAAAQDAIGARLVAQQQAEQDAADAAARALAARAEPEAMPVVEEVAEAAQPVAAGVGVADAPREPWQLTRADFHRDPPSSAELQQARNEMDAAYAVAEKKGVAHGDLIEGTSRSISTETRRKAWEKYRKIQERWQRLNDDARTAMHRGIVQDALARGEPVPPEVLADYPDLMPAPSPAVAPAPEPAPQTLDDLRREFAEVNRKWKNIPSELIYEDAQTKAYADQLNARRNELYRRIQEMEAAPAAPPSGGTTLAPAPEPPVATTRKGQGVMFPAGDDTPLFSDAPMRPQESTFTPQEVQRQESMFDMRPQFGASTGSATGAKPKPTTPDEGLFAAADDGTVTLHGGFGAIDPRALLPLYNRTKAYADAILRNWRKTKDPEVADVALHMVKTLDEAQERLLASLPGLRQPLPNNLTQLQRNQLIDLVDKTLLPQFDDTVYAASRMGEELANGAMLNYRDRRGFDQILSLVFPFHYFWTRGGLSWARRMARKPSLANTYYELERAIRRENENGDLPNRLQGTIFTYRDANGQYRLQNPLMFALPFAQYMPNRWQDPEDASNAVEQWWLRFKQYTPGFLPYIEWGSAAILDQIAPVENGPSRIAELAKLRNYVPLTGIVADARQALTGETQSPYLGGDLFDQYRIKRSLTDLGESGALGADKEKAARIVQNAQQIAVNLERGDDRYTNVAPADREAAEAAYLEAAKVAGRTRLLSSGVGFATGSALYYLPQSEQDLAAQQEQYNRAGYEFPTQPYGSNAAQNALLDENPMLPTTWSKSTSPGEKDPATSARQAQYYDARDAVYAAKQAAVDAALTANPNLTSKEMQKVTDPYYDQLNALDVSAAMTEYATANPSATPAELERHAALLAERVENGDDVLDFPPPVEPGTATDSPKPPAGSNDRERAVWVLENQLRVEGKPVWPGDDATKTEVSAYYDSLDKWKLVRDKTIQERLDNLRKVLAVNPSADLLKLFDLIEGMTPAEIVLEFQTIKFASELEKDWQRAKFAKDQQPWRSYGRSNWYKRYKKRYSRRSYGGYARRSYGGGGWGGGGGYEPKVYIDDVYARDFDRNLWNTASELRRWEPAYPGSGEAEKWRPAKYWAAK